MNRLPIEVATPNDAADASEFKLTDLLRIIRFRWPVILATVAVVVAVTGVVTFNLTPMYSASSVVMLDQRTNNITDVNAVLAGLPTDPTSIENQVQILRSRSLAGKVIDKLKLESDPGFNPELAIPRPNILDWFSPARWVSAARAAIPALGASEESVSLLTEEEKAAGKRGALINLLLASYTATIQGRSTAMNITVTVDNPNRAALIANAIADAYVDDQLNAKFEATQKTTQWLADRVQELSVQARNADAAVQQYKAQFNLSETAKGTSLVSQQVAEFSGQLIVARSALAEKEAVLSRIRELVSSGRSEDVVSIVNVPAIVTLRQQEAEILRQEADFSQRFGPRHPRMIELQSQRKTVQDNINDEVDRVVKNSDNEVAIARARVQSLAASLSQLEGKSTDESRDRVRLSELETTAASTRALYESFVEKFKQTEGQDDVQAPDARVISVAQVPMLASSPNKTRSLQLAGIGGLVLGFFFAFLIEKLDSGFRTAAQVEALLRVPVLTSVPEVGGLLGKSGKLIDQVIDKPTSGFVESLRGIQVGLVLSNVDRRPKVVLVTSALPAEGKTTIAVGLARLAARAGQKVVLVDGDIRRPGVAKSFGMAVTKNDLVDLLTGTAQLTDVLRKDRATDLILLTTRKLASTASDLLGSQAMEGLIATLKDSFDLVIIDSAPVLPVNDSRILAGLADAIVFAVRWEKTPRAAVQQAVQALSAVGASIAGLVLTRAHARRFQYYSYGYQSYSAYNKYYRD